MRLADFIKAQTDPPRMERKYFLEEYKGMYLEPFMTLAPAGLKEIFWKRKVNNIYFDDFNKTFFKDNLIGAQTRLKFRLRWYDDKLSKTNLELKFKDANLVYKLVLPIKNFNLKRFEKGNWWQTNNLPEPVIRLAKRLKPSLINSYNRKYWLTNDKKVRLTIDTDVKFIPQLSNLTTSLSNPRESQKTIIELKYSPIDELAASELIKYLPLSLQKNSKYVEGIGTGIF